MKKAVFTAVAAATMAAVMSIGLVGCGGAGSIKSDEITQEEWVAAFKSDNFKNYKYTYEMKTEGKVDGESGSVSYTYDGVIADGLEYMKGTAKYTGAAVKDDVKSETREAYCDATSLIKVYYSKNDDGKWSKSASGMSASMMVSSYLLLGESYALFEYSKEDNGYVSKSSSSLNYTGVVFKFKDGKLAGIYRKEEEKEDDNNYSEAEMSITFTYGGQSVTLPTVEE